MFPDLCTVCGCEITCDTCGRPTQSGVWLEVEDEDAEDVIRDEFLLDCYSYATDPMSDDDMEFYCGPEEDDEYDEAGESMPMDSKQRKDGAPLEKSQPQHAETLVQNVSVRDSAANG